MSGGGGGGGGSGRSTFHTVIQGGRVMETLLTSTCSFRGCPGVDIQLADGERKKWR